MTPLPKHLEKMRDEFAQAHYDKREKLFNVHEFDRETIAVESCKIGFNQAASIMLKDMEEMAKALEFFSKIKDGLFEDITESELRIVANEALKIYREKYTKQSEGK